jgi:xanthine dehydrogenase accessory factor
MKSAMLHELRRRLQQKQSCAVVTSLDGGDQALVDREDVFGDLALSSDQLAEIRHQLKVDRSRMLEEARLFVRVYGPPPRMIIVGAVHIAQALAPMARLVGFDVTLVDPREGFVRSLQLDDIRTVTAWPDEAMAELAPDARTAIVTLTHDSKLDDPTLIAALRSPAFYIGALGSMKSHAKRLQRLGTEGFAQADLDRIHGPVGLDINSITPPEIAVSILAQVIATLRAGARPK